ncbi:MAG: T9SS type A sorting domain-containing protein [Bacteroidales bacterium]|nr:T9SS type A sorting domain-containing protein [Bacteroidales bacterium]MCF8399510.1 T9SS type A sorting domain-containing protein [Bacteroidales bacterium]
MNNMKRKFIVLKIMLFSAIFAVTINAQEVSTTDQTFAGSDFGTTILVPINTSDIHTSYGNIITATIRVEYDDDLLSYVGYTNVDPTLQNQIIDVFPAGQNGVVQFNIEASDFGNGFQYPDGKSFDIQLTYAGAYSDIDITQAEFFATDFETYNATMIDGSVTGYADISATNGNWNDVNIWTGPMGSLTEPGPGHNVSILTGGTVTVTADGLCNSVTIGDGGQLTLNSTIGLDVTTDFTIESGGSYIENGTLTAGSKTAERYIAAANWADDSDGWHLLSSPVMDQAISGDFIPGGYDFDFYMWDEQTGYWLNYDNYSWPFFDEGIGYLVAYQQASTKVFTGDFNTANETETITNNGSDPQGFNLLGNPYPSAIIWNPSWAAGSVEPDLQVWNSTAGSYKLVTSGHAVPPINGFMIYSYDGSQPVTIPASARAHNSTAWYKNTDEMIVLNAYDLEKDLFQESIIRFNDNSSLDYDQGLDSRFLNGYAPGFYSFDGEMRMASNTVPFGSDLVVPFRFEKNNESSSFMIELAESIEGEDVYLKDLKTNTTVNLSETGSYTFSSEEGDDPDRFELLFGVVGIEDVQPLASAHVYSNGDILTVANVEGESRMDVMDVQGRVLQTEEFNSNGYSTFDLELNTGIYLVRLYNSGEAKTTKVFVK